MNAPFPIIEMENLDHVWFQVAGTRCNLECHHCFISCSPANKSFGFLSLEQVERHLLDATKMGVREYYFTGGEPFLNPEMTSILIRALDFGAATVLTNATVLKPSWLAQLAAKSQSSRYSLEFRVSIDGFDSASNDPIRGAGTFDRAMEGIQKLVSSGFLPIITAVQTWSDEVHANMVASFVKSLKEVGYSRPRIKILPTLKIGAESERTEGYAPTQRVTHEMMQEFDGTQLICHNSRIVTDRGVHVCPILIETSDSLLSQNLSDSRIPFEMKHGACFTCYQYGAICSNPSGKLPETRSKGKGNGVV